jgi:hypothetical protein
MTSDLIETNIKKQNYIEAIADSVNSLKHEHTSPGAGKKKHLTYQNINKDLN